MYLPLIHQIVHSEMELDRLRKIEYQILLNALEQERSLKNPKRERGLNKVGRRALVWLGTQLVNWGTKLQSINTAPTPRMLVNKKLSR
jgi:hypothetical protein